MLDADIDKRCPDLLSLYCFMLMRFHASMMARFFATAMRLTMPRYQHDETVRCALTAARRSSREAPAAKLAPMNTSSIYMFRKRVITRAEKRPMPREAIFSRVSQRSFVALPTYGRHGEYST